MLPRWQQDTITMNGAALHYYRTGHGSGKPALVLVHGFSDYGLCWNPVACELEDQYDIIMPDVRGHGQSARVERGSKLDLVADLVALIRQLGLRQPIVGGHSMGAAIAAKLGAHYPDLASALILEDPPWFAPQPGLSSQRPLAEDSPTGRWIAGLQKLPLEQVIEACRVEHPAWSELTLRTWCEGKLMLDYNFMTSQNNAMGPWQDLPAAIRVPTLLITADPGQGGIVTPALAQQIKQVNASFKVASIPGVGHHIRFGNPIAYMKVVREFLAGL